MAEPVAEDFKAGKLNRREYLATMAALEDAHLDKMVAQPMMNVSPSVKCLERNSDGHQGAPSPEQHLDLVWIES